MVKCEITERKIGKTAACIYNDDGKCTAPDVEIFLGTGEGSYDPAECATYRERGRKAPQRKK